MDHVPDVTCFMHNKNHVLILEDIVYIDLFAQLVDVDFMYVQVGEMFVEMFNKTSFMLHYRP